MKIALIQPGVFHPLGPFVPAALLHLASVLLKQGHEVRILDDQLNQVSPDSLQDADVIGITCMGGIEVNRAMEIVKNLRQNGIHAPFLWGGTQITMIAELALQDPHVDAVIAGFAEETIVEEIGKIANKETLCSKPNNKPHWISMNPDWYPLPYHLIAPDRYSEQIGFPLQTSRGCKGRCEFCYLNQWNNPPIVSLPVETVLQEIQILHHKHNVQQVWFVDDNFFWNRERVLSICEEMVRQKWGMRWIASARVDDFSLCDDSELALVKQSGCVQINFGGESGSDEELHRMNKQITSKNLIDAAYRCNRHNLQSHFNFVLGYPGTTVEDLHKTVRLLRELDHPDLQSTMCPYFRFSVFTPWPGTQGYQTGLQAGFSPPSNLAEWGEYLYFDIERANTVPEAVKKQTKSVFYLDYFLHHFPGALQNLSDHPTVSQWMKILRPFFEQNRESMERKWNEMDFEDSRLFDDFESNILNPIARKNNYLFPI